MKVKCTVIITLAIVFIGAIFGIKTRKTYKEYKNFDDYAVAEMPGKMVDAMLAENKSSLEKSKYILEVEVMEDVKIGQGILSQKVKVKKVIRGKGIREKSQFYIASADRSVICRDVPKDVKAKGTLELYFVNCMKKGEDYLVFLDRKVVAEGGKIYYVPKISWIPTYFSSNKKENKIVKIPKEQSHTYINYSEVRENEFFVDTESGLRKLNEFKREILNKYQISGK